MRSNVSSDDQASCARAGSCLEVWRFNRSLVSCQFNDRIRCSQFEFSIAGLGTLPKLAKVSFTAGEILRLHFPAVGSQLDSLNQPGVHHGKLI